MNTKSDIKLICSSVWYYSKHDEELFFEWIQHIKTIIRIDGIGNELHLYLNHQDIPDDDLREIIALFYRYKIDMKQLHIFLNDKNREWFFEKPKGYWHKKVFGT